MRTLCLFLLVCAVPLNDGTTLLSLESARGKMNARNFLHLHKHRLNVEPLVVLQVEKEMKCVGSCAKSDECFSFNVKKLTANLLQCELMNTTKYLNAENLTQDESSTHWYLQDACVPHPCNHGYCKPNEQTEFTCVCRNLIIGQRCDVCKDPTRNFALGRPTAQSTIYQNGAYGAFGPGLAVDGNKGAVYITPQGKPQCAHTYLENEPWWRVDFGEQVPVARVEFTNRGDCCQDRMRDFEVKIGDSLADSGLANPKCGDRHSAGDGTTSIACTPIVFGRYLVIHSRIHGAINICELEVYCQ